MLGSKNPTETLPIRTLSIELDINQREEFIAQLRKFSAKHHLKFDISFYENNTVFFVFMNGKRLEIIASSGSDTLTKIDISFYEEDPAHPPSQEIVDELFDDLKLFISEIPNTTIIEEK